MIREEFAVVLTLVMLLTQTAVPVFADTNGSFQADAQKNDVVQSPEQQEISAIDKAIILKYIELARFNVHFQLESNYHQPWRDWMYPLEREMGTAGSYANTLTNLSESAHGLNNPDLISKSIVGKGYVSAIAGTALSGTASTLELGQNVWVMMKAKRDGFSPKRSLAFVKKWIKATDKLLDEREELVRKKFSGRELEIQNMEASLFGEIRQELLFEFRKWSCFSRETAWRENTFYTLDAVQNFTVFGSNITALYGLDHLHFEGNAAIAALVGNCIAAINPIFSVKVGSWMDKYQRRKLSKYLPLEKPTLVLPKDIDKLHQENSPDRGYQNELAETVFLSKQAAKLDTGLLREMDKIQKLRQIAQQKVVSGTLIELANTSRGVLDVDGFYGYRNDPLIANRLNFAGRISQATGQTYALIDTPATYFASVRNNRRLAREGLLPSKVLGARLKNLDALEKQIQSPQPYKLQQ